MLGKIKNYLQAIFWQAIRDVRVAGLLAFLVIVLLISWSGVKVIESNYRLQQQIAQLQQKNQIAQLADDNLALQNEYLNTNQYLELAARQNFGLGAPGETELLVPESVALKHVLNLPAPAASTHSASRQPAYQRNLSAWVNFYLHRQSSSN